MVLYIEGDKDQINLSSYKNVLERTLEPNEIPRKILVIPGFRYLGSGKIDRKATVREFLHM
ncbi:MAG TPA: hypothetical protein VLH61_03260 [Bacteroidales bacterium]|nr:hypothetical protein [Bacteroidales bacterium]